jgi:hypothetical protein
MQHRTVDEPRVIAAGLQCKFCALANRSGLCHLIRLRRPLCCAAARASRSLQDKTMQCRPPTGNNVRKRVALTFARIIRLLHIPNHIYFQLMSTQ